MSVRGMSQYKAPANIPPSPTIDVPALGHSGLLMPNIVENGQELGAERGLSYPNVHLKSYVFAVS